MGWLALSRDLEWFQEEKHGRPMKEGKTGKLRLIAQQDYGHTVAVDLDRGVILVDYTYLGMQNDTVEIQDPKLVFYICQETARVGEYFHIESTKPDEEGNYFNTFKPLLWRPIWFTRHISTLSQPIKCIGAQTTLPKEYGRKNVKKLISLFPDGSIGID
jgi:hypothetical protein